MKAFLDKNENKSGVYKIVNIENGRIYIGKAKNLLKRFKSHKRKLLSGKHFNSFLQNDFIKCGGGAFEFHILEIVNDYKDCSRVENKWINKYYDCQVKCYNFMKRSNALPRRVFSNDPEYTRKLISNNSKKMWENEEIRLKILTNKEISQNKPEHRKALSVAQKKSWKNDTARKEKMSIRSKKMWRNEEIRSRIISQCIENRDEDKSREIKIKNKFKFLFNRYKSIVKECVCWSGPNTPRTKTFNEANLLSPEGILYKKIINLRAFAREHGELDNWKLQEVIEMNRWQYKGWIKFIVIEDFASIENFSEFLISNRENSIKKSRNF